MTKSFRNRQSQVIMQLSMLCTALWSKWSKVTESTKQCFVIQLGYQIFKLDSRIGRIYRAFQCFKQQITPSQNLVHQTEFLSLCIYQHTVCTFARHHLWRYLSMQITTGLKNLATSDMNTFNLVSIYDRPFFHFPPRKDDLILKCYTRMRPLSKYTMIMCVLLPIPQKQSS